jgi:hypothetical protein
MAGLPHSRRPTLSSPLPFVNWSLPGPGICEGDGPWDEAGQSAAPRSIRHGGSLAGTTTAVFKAAASSSGDAAVDAAVTSSSHRSSRDAPSRRRQGTHSLAIFSSSIWHSLIPFFGQCRADPSLLRGGQQPPPCWFRFGHECQRHLLSLSSSHALLFLSVN